MNAKAVRKALRRPFEWLGIGLALAVFAFLPRRAVLGLADFASMLMYHLDRKGRKHALVNLRVIRASCLVPRASSSTTTLASWSGEVRNNKCMIVEGLLATKPSNHQTTKPSNHQTTKPPNHQTTKPSNHQTTKPSNHQTTKPSNYQTLIIKRSYRNMARAVAHAFWTLRSAKRRVAAAGEMSPEGKAFLAAHKPAITVSAHLGCWEILSQLAFLEGHEMMSVAKDIGSSGMTSLLMKARKSIGQEIVHADGAFRILMKGLKDGKSLGLLVDQPVRPSDGGIWVVFFGVPYPVSAAPAFFAAKGKAPIIVAWSRPLKDGRYRCEVLGEIPASEARDIWGTTQKIMGMLECAIRRHPSCWLLNYNAFRKHIKPDELAKLREKLDAASPKPATPDSQHT